MQMGQWFIPGVKSSSLRFAWLIASSQGIPFLVHRHPHSFIDRSRNPPVTKIIRCLLHQQRQLHDHLLTFIIIPARPQNRTARPCCGYPTAKGAGGGPSTTRTPRSKYRRSRTRAQPPRATVPPQHTATNPPPQRPALPERMRPIATPGTVHGQKTQASTRPSGRFPPHDARQNEKGGPSAQDGAAWIRHPTSSRWRQNEQGA